MISRMTGWSSIGLDERRASIIPWTHDENLYLEMGYKRCEV